MHDPMEAGAELRRCMTELKGFVGVILVRCARSRLL